MRIQYRLWRWQVTSKLLIKTEKYKHNNLPQLLTFLSFNASQCIFQNVLVLLCTFCIKKKQWFLTDLITDQNQTVSTAVQYSSKSARYRSTCLMGSFTFSNFHNSSSRIMARYLAELEIPWKYQIKNSIIYLCLYKYKHISI